MTACPGFVFIYQKYIYIYIYRHNIKIRVDNISYHLSYFIFGSTYDMISDYIYIYIIFSRRYDVLQYHIQCNKICYIILVFGL